MAAGTGRRTKKRVSQVYNLGRTQGTLDFVDVDIMGDTPLFISPTALAHLPSEWGDGCVFLVQNFFQTVLREIKAGRHTEAEVLLSTLKEPNETHLGLSKGRSRGRALGEGSANRVWKAMAQSVAAKSGLLRDLEDTVLLIEGVGVDIISDITTNIIRAPLIEYTQQMCERFGIPLEEGVASGPLWDPSKRTWFTRYERLPVTSEGKLLLVPKAIVRPDLQFKAEQYYRHYILTHLQQFELNSGSGLVYMLKDGTRKVDKTAVIKKYGTGKKTIVEQTLKHPEVLDAYRSEMSKQDYNPLSHEMIALVENEDALDWDSLLSKVINTPTGKDSATLYENAVEALLTALFYPDLTNPHVQFSIHDGRKRIDIKYTNMARSGFFSWLAKHYPAPLIWIECKNYGGKVANPELDQIAGRFSPSRGRIGIIVCRTYDNKKRFLERCRDTAKDDRGWILALDDDDLINLVEYRKNNENFQQWTLLNERFQHLLT